MQNNVESTETKKEIRKNQNLLVTSGKAIRIFAFWSFLRALLYFMFNQEGLKEMMGVEQPSMGFIVGVEIFALAVIIIYSLFYFHVANCAIDEGKQVKRHKTLLPLAAIILILSLLSVYADITASTDYSIAENIAVTVTDIVSCAFTVQLIRSTLFLRKYPGGTQNTSKPKGSVNAD